MSRSNYCDDLEQKDLAMWRGCVASAIRGKRGQELLRQMLAALDAMPEKMLIARKLKSDEGVCALGSVALAKSIDVSAVDPEEPEAVAALFNIAPCMAAEIAYMNDEYGNRDETPVQRFKRMREWVIENLRPDGGAI